MSFLLRCVQILHASPSLLLQLLERAVVPEPLICAVRPGALWAQHNVNRLWQTPGQSCLSSDRFLTGLGPAIYWKGLLSLSCLKESYLGHIAFLSDE